MTHGSPYHVGKSEDWEEIIADRVGAHIDDQLNIDINGKLFNFRHDIKGSSVPYSKLTQIVKQSVLEDLKSVKHGGRFVDVVVRSHIHYYAEFQLGNKRGIICPCFQFKSKFGNRKCDGSVDIGMVVVDIYEDGSIIVTPHLAAVTEKARDIIYI